ncbi:MAG: LptF/LptG family permease, partial [Eudoraea sp.]|uniref:LptF/LptG family permease n=1 Tax=Eudoraea sp. TaxID=1979955 RepID=UPI003C763110
DKSPFARSNFETYTINIEIPQNDQDLEEERNVRTDKMKNVSRLNKDIDSLRENNVKIVAAFSKNITNRMGAFLPVSQIDTTLKTTESKIDTTLKTTESKIILDTVLKSTKNMVLPILVQEKDTVQIDNVLDLYREDRRIHIVNAAKNSISNILNSVLGKKEELQRRYKIYNMHILSLHKKFALALSCIILFFVGAPLGAIIRKGGLGLPMVIAIVLFLTYYFIGVFAGNYAKEGNIHPIFGAWLSTLIMLPLGIYLTKRATADRGLMDFGYVIEKIKDFFRKKIKVTAS